MALSAKRTNWIAYSETVKDLFFYVFCFFLFFFFLQKMFVMRRFSQNETESRLGVIAGTKLLVRHRFITCEPLVSSSYLNSPYFQYEYGASA